MMLLIQNKRKKNNNQQIHLKINHQNRNHKKND